MVRVTCGQWNASTPEMLKHSVDNLKEYLVDHPTEILLLPEMPFTDWFTSLPQYHEEIWQDAKEAHLHWIDRLDSLDVPTIIGTRPMTDGDGQRMNSSWIWHKGNWQDIHQKYYLPDETGFWEASWYERGNGELGIARIGDLKIGILICTEMWFMSQAREYAQKGVHLLLVPRSTPKSTTEKWIAGGQSAAVISGTYCISSNHSGIATDQLTDLGGVGWIIDPEAEILKTSSSDSNWVTYQIDQEIATLSKDTYPRYVED